MNTEYSTEEIRMIQENMKQHVINLIKEEDIFIESMDYEDFAADHSVQHIVVKMRDCRN